MSDLVDISVTALGAFFVVLAIVLFARYREAARSISESSERTSDLWRALQDRLKKQDERIVDLMSKVEVLQARVTSQAGLAPVVQPVMVRDATALQQVTQLRPPPLQRSLRTLGDLGDTAKAIIELLGRGAKSTREITDATGLSREHTARTMKVLFDGGFVTRNDTAKPFVYQLTEKGRSRLSAG